MMRSFVICLGLIFVFSVLVGPDMAVEAKQKKAYSKKSGSKKKIRRKAQGREITVRSWKESFKKAGARRMFCFRTAIYTPKLKAKALANASRVARKCDAYTSKQVRKVKRSGAHEMAVRALRKCYAKHGWFEIARGAQPSRHHVGVVCRNYAL